LNWRAPRARHDRQFCQWGGNAVTINNLTFTTVSSGAKTLTLTGFNTGPNTFAANLINNGTSTTA